MMTEKACPFAVGQTVVFKHRSGKAGIPGEFGLPQVGDRVTITEIVDGLAGKYIKWAGMDAYPSGALHWTEFAAV